MSNQSQMLTLMCRVQGKERYPCFFLRVLCLSLMASFFLSLYSSPSLAASKHDQLKVVYLLNIMKFIKWPAQSEGQLSLCHTTDSAMKKYFSVLSGKSVKGMILNVVELKPGMSLAECNLVYSGSATGSALSRLINQAREHGVIDVGEGVSYTEAGGVIGFHVVNNKLRFNVNLPEAQIRKVSLSANLIELAYHIIQ